MLAFLIWIGSTTQLSWPYFFALVAVAGLLVWEHRLVSPSDLSKINQAFFNINSYIALVLFSGVLLGLLV
jgi:4-hydroxybenzoate polyprenyltransferase